VRLQRYVQQNGALDAQDGESEVDVRDAQQLSARPLNRVQ
ncbi:unnamed protein product, partial [marine sediment metagenome]